LSLTIGDVELTGELIAPEEGFARWTIPCPDLLPACAAEAEPRAQAHVTRSAAGFDGILSVSNRLGLFSYRFTLTAN
jgi:hypothetical protein